MEWLVIGHLNFVMFWQSKKVSKNEILLHFNVIDLFWLALFLMTKIDHGIRPHLITKPIKVLLLSKFYILT